MENNKRYGLFKLFLIFTMLNVFGIFLYENISENGLFVKKPEFYVASIKSEKKESVAGKTDKVTEKSKNDVADKGGFNRLDKKSLLLVGDSNVYLMSGNKKKYESRYGNNIYWLAESGASADFISKDFMVKLGRFKAEFVENSLNKTKEVNLLKEIKEKNITDVVVMLGVNSLGDKFAEKLGNKLIKFSEISGAKVYYVSVLPYVDKSKYNIAVGDVIRFNAKMKEILLKNKVGYIDAYDMIVRLKGYKDETTDGLHYNEKIYNKVFEKIIEYIMQNN